MHNKATALAISAACFGLVRVPGARLRVVPPSLQVLDPPVTLGNAAAARVRLIVWCKSCQHQVERDPAEMAARDGADTSVPDWAERLVWGKCGSRNVNMLVSGTKRRKLRGS
jgi:hypothetical protein